MSGFTGLSVVHCLCLHTASSSRPTHIEEMFGLQLHSVIKHLCINMNPSNKSHIVCCKQIFQRGPVSFSDDGHVLTTGIMMLQISHFFMTASDPLSPTALTIPASFHYKHSFHSLSLFTVWCTKVDEECELISNVRPISLASLLAMAKYYMLSDLQITMWTYIFNCLPHIFYFKMRLWLKTPKDLWINNKADVAANQPVNKLASGLSYWLQLLTSTNKRVKWDLVALSLCFIRTCSSFCVYASVNRKTWKHCCWLLRQRIQNGVQIHFYSFWLVN